MKNLCLLTLLSCLSQASIAQSPSLFERPGKSEAPRFIENIELSSDRGYNTSSLLPETVYPILPAPVSSGGTALRTVNRDVQQLLNPLSIEDCAALQFKYAILTDQEVESINNLPLYEFVDDWFGTRYRYGGTDRTGIDCSAFVGRLMKDVYGFELPRTAREQYKAVLRVPDFDLTEGDLVFFNTTGGVSHVGLYLGSNKFVHASTSGGVTISDLSDKYYAARYLGAGRLLPPAASK